MIDTTEALMTSTGTDLSTNERVTILFPSCLYVGRVAALDDSGVILDDVRYAGWEQWEDAKIGEPQDGIGVTLSRATILGGGAIVWLDADNEIHTEDYPSLMGFEDTDAWWARLTELRNDPAVRVLTWLDGNR